MMLVSRKLFTRAVPHLNASKQPIWSTYVHGFGWRAVLQGFATGGVLWSVGDATAQMLEAAAATPDTDGAVQTRRKASIDFTRLGGSALFGSVFAGAIATEWYRFLDVAAKGAGLRYGSWRFVSAKLLMEFAIWHPVTLMLYWLVIGAVQGRAVSQTITDARKDFAPTIAAEYALWLPIDLVNFWKVPLKYQVMVLNLGCLVESTLLSYVHEHGFPQLVVTERRHAVPVPPPQSDDALIIAHPSA